jgi:hypothetical protein
MATNSETVSSSPKAGKILVFSWSEVDPDIIRNFLEVAYQETGQLGLLPRIAQFNDHASPFTVEPTIIETHRVKPRGCK